MYINLAVVGKRTLGSISCNPTTSRSLRPIPLNWVPLELLQDSDSSQETIAHQSSSYPEYLSPSQDKDEQRRIVWARLKSHRTNLAGRLSEQKARYLALRQELNLRTSQVETSHERLFRDTSCPCWYSLSAIWRQCSSACRFLRFLQFSERPFLTIKWNSWDWRGGFWMRSCHSMGNRLLALMRLGVTHFQGFIILTAFLHQLRQIRYQCNKGTLCYTFEWFWHRNRQYLSNNGTIKNDVQAKWDKNTNDSCIVSQFMIQFVQFFHSRLV